MLTEHLPHLRTVWKRVLDEFFIQLGTFSKIKPKAFRIQLQFVILNTGAFFFFTFAQGYNLPELQLSTVLGSTELKPYWGYGYFCENIKTMMLRENNAPLHIFLT